MALSVKNKIRMGTLFLFLLLLLTGGVGIFYMSKLKTDSEAILQDNYKSLIYCYDMEQQLDRLNTNHDSSLIKFKNALDDESNNITEVGEGESVRLTKIYFDKLKAGDSSQQNILLLRTA